METIRISGVQLHELYSGGYRNMKKNMQTINDLNVFPVPDGDTGTNMVQTFGGGLRNADSTQTHVGQYMEGLSKAVLLSARGNSGVILSQFIHGLYRGFQDKAEVEFSDFAHAFVCAKEDAYKSIITPTEGTILTLIREGADFLTENAHKYGDLLSGFEALQEVMTASLAKTPDLLPVLKEAGVVDSGGAGLLCFVEGICALLRGEDIEDTADLADIVSHAPSAIHFGPDSRLEYGYCTEFILQLMNYKTDLKSFDLAAFIKPLEAMGDSLVAVHNDGIVKIHIHTFTPDLVLGYGRQFGEFVTLKIENMSIQHSETQAAAAPVKKEKVKYAIVAVAAGQGIVDYFYSIGAHVVIDGGQTNNPSVDAFLEAFDRFEAEHIVVLPNNSNIILTANQAAQMYNKSDVRVIPTRSIVEGYSALSMMNLWSDTVEELLEDMTSNLDSVITGYVTPAIRDSHMDGLAVSQGEYMGLKDKHLVTTAPDLVSAACQLIRKVNEETPKDVIILFYGSHVTEEQVARVQQFMEEEYPLVDIGFVEGKQEVYDFIISME